MRIQSQLTTYGYWGAVGNAFAMNCTSRAMWERAKKDSLIRLGKISQDTVMVPANEDDKRPIILDYSLYANVDVNAQSNYTTIGGDNDVVTRALVTLDVFPGTTSQGVYHRDASANNPFSYSSTVPVGPNEPHLIRVIANKPPKGQSVKLHQWTWDRWTFQIRNGNGELIRRATTYTEANENTLIALQSAGSLTSIEQQQLADLIKSCYEVKESVDLGDVYAQLTEVVFIPEPAGRVHVIVNGGVDKAQVVEIPLLLNARRANTVWADSTLSVRLFGGAIAWQVGYLAFAKAGKATFGPDANGPYDFGSVSIEKNADTSLAGTDVQFALNHDSSQFSVIAALTGDGTRTPFLYSFTATTPPSERDGSDIISFDTADLATNPVTQISYSFDGPHNAREATITMRNISGNTLKLDGVPVGEIGYGLDGLENRTFDLQLPNPTDLTLSPFISGGIIVASKLERMRDVKVNTTPQANTNPWSSVELSAHDGWAILNEMPCHPSLIADNLHLGQALGRALSRAGFIDTELAGVDPSTGPLIAPAAFGEDWREVSSEDTSLGDWIRHLMELYGLGLYFRQAANGVWSLGAPSLTSIGTWTTHANGDPSVAGAGRRVAMDLTYIRDACDFYNVFRVEGSNGTDGKLIQVTRRLSQSIDHTTGGTADKTLIGRVREYPTLRSSSIRTLDQANYALRSLVWLYGRPGRRVQFSAWLNTTMMPWSRFVIGDTPHEVKAINGADIQGDRMLVVAREVL